MGQPELDISSLLSWNDGLPCPQWDIIEAWIDAHCKPADHRQAWIEVCRQWMAELTAALGAEYVALESKNFLAVVSRRDYRGERLPSFAERCRTALRNVLGDDAALRVPGKQCFVALGGPSEYYRYLSQYDAEGEYGGSSGSHIRNGYPHMALHGRNLTDLENVLAHELTHAALHHLHMPLWLEEGLAQLFEHEMTGRSQLLVDGKMAQRHKRYWADHTLDDFWRGGGFSSAGKAQELSYQLAEILVRLLVSDSQPRWFGWVREPQQRFFAFLREAAEADCGAEACREHLRMELAALAARFLGPGDWEPRL